MKVAAEFVTRTLEKTTPPEKETEIKTALGVAKCFLRRGTSIGAPCTSTSTPTTPRPATSTGCDTKNRRRERETTVHRALRLMGNTAGTGSTATILPL